MCMLHFLYTCIQDDSQLVLCEYCCNIIVIKVSLRYTKLVFYKYISRSDRIDRSTFLLSHLTYLKCLHLFSVNGNRAHNVLSVEVRGLLVAVDCLHTPQESCDRTQVQQPAPLPTVLNFYQMRLYISYDDLPEDRPGS